MGDSLFFTYIVGSVVLHTGGPLRQIRMFDVRRCFCAAAALLLLMILMLVGETCGSYSNFQGAGTESCGSRVLDIAWPGELDACLGGDGTGGIRRVPEASGGPVSAY